MEKERKKSMKRSWNGACVRLLEPERWVRREKGAEEQTGEMQRDSTKNSSLPQQLPIRAVKQRERPDARPCSAEERCVSPLFFTPVSLWLSNQSHSPSVWLLCRITAIFPKNPCSTFIHVSVHALRKCSSNIWLELLCSNAKVPPQISQSCS